MGCGGVRIGRLSDQPPADQYGIRVGEPCGYESASGLPEWLSRNPIGEEGGYLFENERHQGSTRCNANGYINYPSGSPSNGIREGTYKVLPKNDYREGDAFPQNQPSITHPDYSNPNSPNYAPGRAGSDYKPTVRIHNQSSNGSRDSLGCVTVSPDWTRRIWDTMNRNLYSGGTTLINYYNGGSPSGQPVR